MKKTKKKKKKTKAELKEEAAIKARLKKRHDEEIDKLFNRDVIDTMLKISEYKEAVRTYYYWVSPLWKAIREHIRDAKDCVIINREGCMVSHRGTGVSISLKEAHLHSDYVCTKNCKRVPATTFQMKLTVEYFEEGYEGEWPLRSYDKTYYIDPPIKLEKKFTQKGFNAWVEELRKKRDRENEKEDIAQLKKLMKKYKGRLKEIS